jgi:hypothetical protein
MPSAVLREHPRRGPVSRRNRGPARYGHRAHWPLLGWVYLGSARNPARSAARERCAPWLARTSGGIGQRSDPRRAGRSECASTLARPARRCSPEADLDEYVRRPCAHGPIAGVAAHAWAHCDLEGGFLYERFSGLSESTQPFCAAADSSTRVERFSIQGVYEAGASIGGGAGAT